jgi:DNA-binding MarR family transcriptional regulator
MWRMEMLPYDLVETARLMRRGFNRRAAVLGTTREQWRVLVRLHRHGDDLRQIDLAEALEVEPITLCRMIDRLEEAGLVERRSDKKDRRAWRIHLTAKAQPIIDHLSTLFENFSDELLAGIAPADLAVTVETLERLRGNLASMDESERQAS